MFRIQVLLLFSCLYSAEAQEFQLYERDCKIDVQQGVSVKQLIANARPCGYAVWIATKDNSVQAEYLVKSSSEAPSPYDVFRKRGGRQDLLLLTSAGFVVQNYDRPLGLCATDGDIMNYHYSRAMDGLVVIQEGTIRVFDLTKEIDVTPHLRGKISSTEFKSRFLSYIKSQRASVFQTHLLAYANELTVTPAARDKQAIRKVLVHATDSNDRSYLMLYYLQQGFYLYDASAAIYHHLQDNNYQIDYMLNLDTGAHDALEINDKMNTCNHQKIEGFNSAYSSNNLLILTRP